MSPSKYLLHVNSRPTAVSDELWREWYIKEHVPDLVNSGTSSRAAFYEEIGHPLAPNADHPRKWLALYQTDHEECLKTKQYEDGVRHSSELFAKEGSKSDQNRENGEFDARNYALWQEYDPNGVGEKPAKNILVVYMNPQDEEDFEKWYREEHLHMLSKLPGYRRSLRYKIGPKTVLTKDESPPPYLAIHEVDSVEAFGGKEAEAANSTEGSIKHIRESKPFTARAFKLVQSEGY